MLKDGSSHRLDCETKPILNSSKEDVLVTRTVPPSPNAVCDGGESCPLAPGLYPTAMRDSCGMRKVIEDGLQCAGVGLQRSSLRLAMQHGPRCPPGKCCFPVFCLQTAAKEL
jgi:hypothetical protein